jgi:hypothetical protein
VAAGEIEDIFFAFQVSANRVEFIFFDFAFKYDGCIFERNGEDVFGSGVAGLEIVQFFYKIVVIIIEMYFVRRD